MLKHNIQDRGTLSFAEFKDLDFYPKRIMLMYNVPKGEIRGRHGHKRDKHYIICSNGRVKITLTNKEGTVSKILEAGDSILQDTYTWGIQEYLEENTVLTVLCSENFDKDEYIHDIDEILKK
tara:strand:+ start:134 stop:499 length:366 start_codon:yes stop_codon:yes gene_type:complete